MARPPELPRQLRTTPFDVHTARASGLSDQRMRYRDLRRPHRGVRVPGHLDDTFLRRCGAYATIMRPDQFFSHITAARLWEIPVAEWTPEEPLHVTTRAPRRAPRVAGVVGHQAEDPAILIAHAHDLPVSDPVSTWLRLSAQLSHYSLVAAADYLVRTPHFSKPGDVRPYTSIEEVARRLTSFRGRGRREASVALPRVRIGVDSPRESRLRLLLVDAGLPEPVTDYELRDGAGERVAWLDMYYPGLELAVEYDGQQHRTNDRQYSHDVDRIDAIRALGQDIVRVDKFALEGSGADAVSRVTAHMRAQGWPDRAAT
jgi:hypothetical protein